MTPTNVEHTNTKNDSKNEVTEVTNLSQVNIKEFKIQTLITNEKIRRAMSRKAMQEHFKLKKQKELKGIAQTLGVSVYGNKDKLSSNIVNFIKESK